MHHPFTHRVIHCIRLIPQGRVATYGQIATLAGNRRSARQVARILHTCSSKHALPWHRVIGGQGRITLPQGQGYEEQKKLLVREGIIFDTQDMVDLEKFLWQPEAKEISQLAQHVG